jgi:hypothetical protein
VPGVNWRDLSMIRYSGVMHADRYIKKLVDEMLKRTKTAEFGANYPGTASSGDSTEAGDSTPVRSSALRRVEKRRRQKGEGTDEESDADAPLRGTPLKVCKPTPLKVCEPTPLQACAARH